MRFESVGLDALFARHERQSPIGAHLEIVVQRFRGLMIERVLRALFLLRPDEGFVRVGKTDAAKIRHRIIFDPQDVVENPEAQVLHDRADAIDVVIRADDPERACVFQHALTRAQPTACELIVSFEILELIPAVVDRVHFGEVGTIQLVAELQVIRRVGEDHIHRVGGERAEDFDAIAAQDLVEGEKSHESNYTVITYSDLSMNTTLWQSWIIFLLNSPSYPFAPASILLAHFGREPATMFHCGRKQDRR